MGHHESAGCIDFVFHTCKNKEIKEPAEEENYVQTPAGMNVCGQTERDSLQ